MASSVQNVDACWCVCLVAALPTSIDEDRAALEAVRSSSHRSDTDKGRQDEDGGAEGMTAGDADGSDASFHETRPAVSLPNAECHMEMAIEW